MPYSTAQDTSVLLRQPPHGKLLRVAQEEDGDCVTDDEESDYSTEDDQPESEYSHSVRGCLENFQMYDRLEIGEPVWAELALPTTWPPCIAGLHLQKWRHALPVTA